MAEQLQRINSTPGLQVQNVTSRARGYESIAGLFKGASEAATKSAAQSAQVESKAGLYTSTAMMSQARTDYDIAIKANPNPAAVNAALTQFNSASDAIMENAAVNAEDRAALQKQMLTDKAAVQKDAAFNNIQQAKLNAQITFSSNFPLQLRNISRDILENPDNAQQIIQATYDTMKEGVASGVLSVKDFEKYNTLLTSTMERSYLLIERRNELTAHGYHKDMAFTAQGHVPGAPHNGVTGALNDGLVSEYNYQGVISSIQTGAFTGDLGTSMYAITKLSDEQFSKTLMTMDGVATAQGLINSGMPYQAIQERVDYLNKRKGSTLTTHEEAERDNLSMYLTNIQYNFLDTIRSTPVGKTIAEKYGANVTAIQNNPSLSPQERDDMMSFESNRYLSEIINYGHAIGVPAEYIKPIDTQTAAETQGAFNFGADPAIAISRVNNLNPTNAAYLAASMKYANEQETIMTTSLLRNDKSDFSSTLIAANQKGVPFNKLNFSSDTITETQLRAKVISKMSSITQYLSRSSQDLQRAGGAVDMVTNTVKYLALKEGDLSMKNTSRYIAEAVDGVGKAYKIQSGHYYSFNGAQQNISDHDALSLAAYARNQAIVAMGQGRSREELEANLDVNPLYVSMNEAGLVNVSDMTGTIVWQSPYTSSMMNAARANVGGMTKADVQKILLETPHIGFK